MLPLYFLYISTQHLNYCLLSIGFNATPMFSYMFHMFPRNNYDSFTFSKPSCKKYVFHTFSICSNTKHMFSLRFTSVCTQHLTSYYVFNKFLCKTLVPLRFPQLPTQNHCFLCVFNWFQRKTLVSHTCSLIQRNTCGFITFLINSNATHVFSLRLFFHVFPRKNYVFLEFTICSNANLCFPYVLT